MTFGANNRCITIKTKKGMKKILFLVAAVASIMLTACVKEEYNVSENAPVGTIEFTASFDAETKTTLNNGKTEWLKGDEISINGVKFTANEAGASVKFTNKETPQGEFKAPFTAVYPYSKELPATQTVKNGTFANESVVSVAYIEGNDENNLTFKHVSSVIKFQVANDVASDIVFESSQNLAGKLTVNADATYTVASAGSKKITVKAEGGTFKKGETYYVSVLPTSGTTKVDFSVKVEGVAVKSGKASFLRNTIVDAKSIEVKYMYLKPNSNWMSDSARFAMYTWGSPAGDVWVNMIEVDGNVYRGVVPYNAEGFKYVRMNPATTENNWNTGVKWNETSNLGVPKNNDLYTITEGAWDNGSGSHSTYFPVYLSPGVWSADNARFTVYAWNNQGNTWINMIKAKSNPSYYVALLPEGYKDFKFVRMNPNVTENNWNDGVKWNECSNLTSPTDTKVLYKISNWNGGSWSEYIPKYLK